MPLKSKSQLAWLKANRPDLVEEFLASTSNVKDLPDKVKEPARYGGKKNSSKSKTKQKKGRKA